MPIFKASKGLGSGRRNNPDPLGPRHNTDPLVPLGDQRKATKRKLSKAQRRKISRCAEEVKGSKKGSRAATARAFRICTSSVTKKRK